MILFPDHSPTSIFLRYPLHLEVGERHNLHDKDQGWLTTYPDQTEMMSFNDVRRFGDSGKILIVTYGNGVVTALRARQTLVERGIISNSDELDMNQLQRALFNSLQALGSSTTTTTTTTTTPTVTTTAATTTTTSTVITTTVHVTTSLSSSTAATLPQLTTNEFKNGCYQLDQAIFLAYIFDLLCCAINIIPFSRCNSSKDITGHHIPTLMMQHTVDR